MRESKGHLAELLSVEDGGVVEAAEVIIQAMAKVRGQLQ